MGVSQLLTLKAASTWSRSCCFLSPWMADEPNSRFKFHASWSHMRFVEQKMRIRVPRGKDLHGDNFTFQSRKRFVCKAGAHPAPAACKCVDALNSDKAPAPATRKLHAGT